MFAHADLRGILHPDQAFFINHKRRPVRYTHKPLQAIKLCCFATRVGKQDKWQPVMISESPVRSFIIHTYADHFCTHFFEFIITVPKTACFFCTPIGFILRIEIDHQILSANKIRQTDLQAVRPDKVKSGALSPGLTFVFISIIVLT